TDFMGASDSSGAILIQEDGRILVAGIADQNGTLASALARYLPDGGLDVSFGDGGRALTLSASTDTGLGANGAALGRCTLVTAATWSYTVGTLHRPAFGVARYYR